MECFMKPRTCAFIIAGLIGVSLSLYAQQAAPDIILTNGKIITVDQQFSIAQAVAVRGDRVVAVGTNQDITRIAGTGTRRIDLRGRSVVPGFIDNHAHFQEEGAYWTQELRFDNIDSRKQALEMIRAKAQAVGPGKWVYNLGGWSPDSSSRTRSRSRGKNWIRCRRTTRSTWCSAAPRCTSTARRSRPSASRR
jgi:hypothetical protein